MLMSDYFQAGESRVLHAEGKGAETYCRQECKFVGGYFAYSLMVKSLDWILVFIYQWYRMGLYLYTCGIGWDCIYIYTSGIGWGW